MIPISLGVSQIIIDGTDLGSVVSASIDSQIDVLPTHFDKVGSAKIVGSRQLIKSLSGVLNVSTEEIGTLASTIDKMMQVLNGSLVTRVPFSANFPLTGGGISGELLLLPNFSASVNVEGWSSITIQPPICGTLNASPGSVDNMTVVGGVPFLNVSKKGALTVDKNALCAAVQCNGAGVAELNLSISCQYTPIYRDNNPWPIDYVIDSAKISADIGLYDFSLAQNIYEEEASVIIDFVTIGGSKIPLSLGTKCAKILSGMKTSNGINTWHIKVEGSAA